MITVNKSDILVNLIDITIICYACRFSGLLKLSRFQVCLNNITFFIRDTCGQLINCMSVVIYLN